MKAQITVKISMITFFSLSLFFSLAAYASETYKLDPVHTSVVFRIKHLGVSYVFGRFNGPTGTFIFNNSSPSNSSINMQVNAKNIDTANDKRDKHLRSPDFFSVDQYSSIAFRSTAVKKLDNSTYQVSGELTLLGKTRPINVKVNEIGAGKDPWGNYRRGFDTSFTIKRSDFGMDFMLSGLSDEVDITVSVEGIRQ